MSARSIRTAKANTGHKTPLRHVPKILAGIAVFLVLGEMFLLATGSRILVNEHKNNGLYPYTIVNIDGSSDTIWPGAWECSYFNGKTVGPVREASSTWLFACPLAGGPGN